MDRQTISTIPCTSVLKIQNIPKVASIEAVVCWLRLATEYFPAFLCVQETATSLTAVAIFKNCDIDLSNATSFAQCNAIDGERPTLEMMSMPVCIRVYSAKGMLTETILQTEFPACTEMVLQNCHFALLTVFDYAAYLAVLEYTASEHVDVRVISYNHDTGGSEWHTYAFHADDLLHVAPGATPLQLVANGVPPESVHVLNEELKSTLAHLHVTPSVLIFFNDSVCISFFSEKDYRLVKDQANSEHGLQLCGVRLAVRDLLSDSAKSASNSDVLLHNLGEVTKDEIKYFAWALADVPVTKVEFVRERSTNELSALVCFRSPLDIGRLCKRLELIQLSGLTVVAERARPAWLAIVSDLPANVDPSVVVSVLDEAQTPVVSCSPTKVPGEWLLTFSSSQDRDAAVDASRKIYLASGAFILRTEFSHNSVVPADGHRTRRELNLRFLKECYWRYAWQHDRPWITSLLAEYHCEGDYYGEHIASVLGCSRLHEVTNRRQGSNVWADLRCTLRKAFEERYDCFVLPWSLAVWKLVSNLPNFHESFSRQLRSERGRVAMMEVAPSTACDNCRCGRACWLARDAKGDRGRQACRRDIRRSISLSCRCAPSAVLIGIRNSVATLRQLPQLVELLQSSVASSTVCCLPAVAQLLAVGGTVMAGNAISVAVDEARSQVTFIGDALVAGKSIEFLRDPAGPIHHCEVPLTPAARTLLATNRRKTATLIRRVIAQAISAKRLSEKLTWMVDSSLHAAVVLFATSEVVLQTGRCIFEELVANGSLEWPVGYDRSLDDDDATWQKLQRICDEYRPAVIQAKPAGGGFGPCITFVCRRSSAPALTASLSFSLRKEVIVTSVFDLHPVLALWLHRPTVAPKLGELQLPARSIADGRVLSFAAPGPARGCEVIVMQGSQSGLATLKSTVASLLCLDQFKVLKVTFHVPGGRRYFASVEGKRLLDSIIEKTGTVIVPMQQGGLSIGNSTLATHTGDEASTSHVRGSEAQVTCIDAEFDDRSCCHWQGVWIVVQHVCLSYVDCDVIVLSAGLHSGGRQVIDAQVDYPSDAMAAEGLPSVTVTVGHAAGLRCKAILYVAAGLPNEQLVHPDAVKERLFFVVFRVLSAAAELGHRVVALTCFRGAVGSADALGATDCATLLVSVLKQVLLSPSLIGRLSRVLLVDESPGVVKLLRSSMEREFADQPRSRLVPPPSMANELTLSISARRNGVISGQPSGPLAEAISWHLELLDVAAACGIILSPADIAGLAAASSRLAQIRMTLASAPFAATSQARDVGALLGSTGPFEHGQSLATSLLHSAIGALEVLFRPPFTTLQLPSGFSPFQLLSGAHASVEHLLSAGQLACQTSSAAVFNNKRQLDAAGVVIHVRYANLAEQEADAYVLPISDVDPFRDKFTRELLVQLQYRWSYGTPLELGSAYGVAAPAHCRCKFLIFAVCGQLSLPLSQADYICKAMEAALIAAERNGLSTVAILPFGVGCGSVHPLESAVLAMKGIHTFCRSRRSNTTFRVIIVVPTFDLLQAFEAAFADQLTPHMPYGRGIASDSWRDQALRQFMDSTINLHESRPSETAVLICGPEDSILTAAALLLERCRSKLKARSLVIDDSQELISMLSSEQIHHLACLASKDADGMELWLEHERPTTCSIVRRTVLKVASLDDDAVSDMALRLTDILRKEQAAFTEENRMVSSVVWQHRFGPLGFWHNYGATVSLKLEKAYMASESLVTYVNAAGTYVVDLRLMTDTRTGSAVNVSAVRRLPITSSDLPSYWYQSNSYMEVSLRVDTHAQEFSSVASAFAGSLGMPHTIVEILRIQNPILWRQYAVKKEDTIRNLMFQAGAEWDLWHGAPAAAVESICREGFNRSLCGKNGVRYGQGAYFARSANYAACPQFAVHDGNNVKCMLLAKVLVGDFEVGHCHMRATNYKPYAKIPRRFDSSANDAINPSVFVTYHDAQAYPAYVIKFIETGGQRM